MTFALALAGIFVQTPSTDAPAAEPTSVPVAHPIVRRGVNTAPRIAPNSITIRNSGSTNVLGYTIVVHTTGDADVTVNGETTPKTLPAPQTKWLFEKVRAATPLDTMPTGGCMKSTSFGSATSVSYGGATSPDISCGGDPTMREIARTVGVVVTRLDVRPLRPLRPARQVTP